MPVEITTREYPMQDADLCAFAYSLISNMTRDDTEFANRGVTAGNISALEDLVTAFEVFPNDDYYRADVSLAVQNKEETRLSMQVKIRDIIQCAVIKWGEGSPQYKKFSAQKMTRESDKVFITTARQVATVATGYLADLTSVGLTSGMITGLTTAADTFHSQMITILDAQELRDSKTQERITKGNEIYSFITRYCTIGKIIWDDEDESKYNDYVIYHKPLNLPSKVQGLEYAIPTNTAKWLAAALAVSYELEYKSESPSGAVPDWVNIYAGAELSFVHNPGAGAWLYRCRGKNENGGGDWSNLLLITL
jgi:hypothetical protein